MDIKIRKIKNQDLYKLYNVKSKEIIKDGTKKELRKHLKIMKGGEIDSNILNDVIKNTCEKNPNKELNGYNLDDSISNKTGKIYYNPETNHTIVSHRGTKGVKDWANNVAYMTGLYDYTHRSKQGKRLQEKASKKYGDENISTVGYSQGAINASKYGANSKEIINVNRAYNPLISNPKNKNEYNIRSSKDLISAPKLLNDKIVSITNPKWSRKHNLTIDAKSNNPLTEHNSDILQRLPNKKVGRK